VKSEKLIGILAALVLSVGAWAQNMTSSPFSRYAYGDLNENVPTGYRAMGGVGFGMRNNRAINPAQPASYTSCDSLTFMMDIAASANWSRYRDASGMRNKANGNLEYLTIQVPLFKQWIAASVGLIPYSSVGYDITLSDSVNSDYHYTKLYSGEGNLSEVYGGLSFNICNWFAVGANIYYMWGDLSHLRTLTFAETGMHTTIQDVLLSVSSVRFRYGAQFFHTWGDHSVVLGGMFENKKKLSSEYVAVETQSDDSIPIYEGLFQTPMAYGAGVSYNWANRLTIAVDFERQCMSSALYNGAEGRYSGLQDKNRYAFGVEYRHNPMGRKYVDRMLWRAGVNVQDEYLVSIGAKRVTASIGIGFPLWTIGTVINTTIEYSHRGSETTGLVDNSLRFTIGASIAESWFFKRKL